MPRILTDNDFDEAIVRGLARRVATLDWVPLRALADTRASDEEVMRLALAESRVLLTQDGRTLHSMALQLVARDEQVPRVVVVPQNLSRAFVLDQLELLLLAGTDADWGVGVVRLPLP